ncbi:hypothetical protein J6590_072974 [Homalodisca vitripennis]|nr:hypothetical protein J6590_072974 [Homalodisca vitripennis]
MSSAKAFGFPLRFNSSKTLIKNQKKTETFTHTNTLLTTRKKTTKPFKRNPSHTCGLQLAKQSLVVY